MGVKLGVVRRAEGRNRHLPDPQRPGLRGEMRPEVDPGLRALGNAQTEGIRDLRTYFITSTANTYATMYYDT